MRATTGTTFIRRAVAAAMIVALAGGCAQAPVPSAANRAPRLPLPANPVRASEAPSPSPEPSSETLGRLSEALVPVTGFWSKRRSITRAELAAAVAGTAADSGSVLVSSADVDGLAAALGVTPGPSVDRLSAAAIVTQISETPDTLGIVRAEDVGPGMRALAVDGVNLYGEQRIADLASWPLLVTSTGGTPSTFDPAALWTLAAGGDVMLDRAVYDRAVLKGLGPDYPWAGGTAKVTDRTCCGAPGFKVAKGTATGNAGALASLFRSADVALVNLEGPAPDAFAYHPEGGLIFTMDPALLVGLAHAGIDVTSLANNHIRNAGPTGIADTIRNLDAIGVGHMGAGANWSAARAPAWVTAGGLRIAILGYNGVDMTLDATPGSAGAAPLNEALMTADVQAARAVGADVVVVVPHWGVEYSDKITAAQRGIASALFAAGADVILGSHSHWAGPLELVDGHLVVYSFGDLVFDLGHDERTQEAMVAELTFAGRNLVQVDLHPTLILDSSQPNLLEPAGGGDALLAAIRAGSERLSP
jgi:poly-gamma-glutamate synthesis protein (capsule biosynthesis protein)